MTRHLSALSLLFATSLPVLAQIEARQDAYFKSSSPCPCLDDYYGYSVALSYPWAVVGHPNEDSDAKGVNGDPNNENDLNSGAAWVYFHDGLSWSEHTYLKPSNAGGDFGHSVAIDGDTIVVGAPQESSNATGVDGDQSDTSTSSAGAAYVFVRDGNDTWSQQAYLKASNTAPVSVPGNITVRFGTSVAISADTIVVGAPGERSNATGVNGDETDTSLDAAGAAYVFHRSAAGVWSQQAYLKASNTTGFDNFGDSVSIDGEVAVVGAHGEDSGGMGVNPADTTDSTVHSNSGAAYVYSRAGAAWTFRAHLKSAAPEDDGWFGISTAVEGDTIAIGARNELDLGRVFVFVRSGATYVGQAILTPSQTDPDQEFGAAISLSGENLLVGAFGADADAGRAYFYRRNAANSWNELVHFVPNNPGGGDFFADSVAIDGFRALVGAHREDSVSNGINSEPFDNVAANVGAAYGFTFTRPLEILNCSYESKTFEITFVAETGLTGWQLHGGVDFKLTDDLTSETTFTEISVGRYRASVDVDSSLVPRYFFQINRDE